jgi:O-antigen/teichoic acid export membrane protein
LALPVFFPLLIGTRVRDVRESELLLCRLALGVALVCSIPAALLAATAPELLGSWLQAVATPQTAAALQILCAGALVSCVSQVFFLQVQTLGRTKAIAAAHLAQLPGYLLLLWWSANHYGLVGVALAWSLRMVADALLFCAMAASSLGGPARARLWRTFAATLAFGVVLAGLSQVGSVALRSLAVAVPLVVLLASAKSIFAFARNAAGAALGYRGSGA